MRRFSIITCLSLALLAACGGGKTLTSESGATSTTGTGTTTGTTTTATAASLTAISSVASIPADGSASATITVLARNSANDLISGVPVTFSSGSGGLAVTQATTNASGAASATLSTAGDPTLRTITVTATASGLTATVKVQVVASLTAATTAVASLTLSSSATSILDDGSTTATISALAVDASNNVLAGVPITFKATSGAIQPSGTVTDATGTLTATLSTGSNSSPRAITVTGSTASLSSTVIVNVVAPTSPTLPVYSMGNGTGTSFTANFIELGANGITGTLVPAGSTLAAGGTVGLNITIVDQTGKLYNANPVTVTFNSPCIANNSQSEILPSGSATAVTSITTATGSISATYVANGCSGSDIITASASVGTQNLAATATVAIAPASVGSIQFISATPATIGLKGTGLGETSTVVFKVTNSTGGASPNVPVCFTLDTSVGGLSVTSMCPTTATSASDGTVQAVVSAGTVHTVVRVTAATQAPAPALSTQSSQLTVTTGLPASSAFSIALGAASNSPAKSLGCPNVEAFGIDGVTVPVTVRLADRYNNPVPDGTSVAFTTDGGHIGGSCTTPSSATSPGDGTCSVTWTSANPRPGVDPTTGTITLGDPTTYGYPVGYPAFFAAGRASILATTIGEESFTDLNATGFYQSGDPFVNLGEPYRDDNENGQYDLGEYFLDFNGNQVRNAGTGSFVGITCTGILPTSTCTTSTLAIGAPHLMVMSTSGANISLAAAPGFVNSGTALQPSLSIANGTSGTITLNVKDTNGNAMAAGTLVGFALNNSNIGATLNQIAPTAFGCDADLGGEDFSASLTTTTGLLGSGSIVVTVTSPSGSQTALSIPVVIH